MKFIITFILCISIAKLSAAQESENAAAVKWVNENMVPLSSYLPGTDLTDLSALNSSIGSSRIVALGECTHGSSEIFSMKHRMLQYLVIKKGFTIFSIEASMAEAYELNQYINGGKGDAKKLQAGMYFWTWYTQEVLDMIQWMKQYNDTASKKILFTGFDMQTPILSSKIVRGYATEHQLALDSTLNEFDTLHKESNIKKNAWKERRKKMTACCDKILETLNNFTDATHDKKWVTQNAVVMQQYASGKDRDESMALNAKWILDDHPNEKMLIWAHNDHIRKSKDSFNGVRMGNYLNQWYGKDYMAIGFSTAEGTYTAVIKNKGIDSANLLTVPEKRSCEYIFSAADADNFIIDLRKANKDTPGSAWVFDKRALRALGALTNDRFQFLNLVPAETFNMLIFIRNTSSSHCFSVQKKS